jgi:regulator of cell morphogenesis and NO signaling
MPIEITKPVGEIAVEFPASIPVFEDLKIDYCCGGTRSLKDACALAGVDVEKVAKSLERRKSQAPAADAAVDWSQKSMGELSNYILEKHHVFTRAILGRLRELSAKVAKVHGVRHPELARVEAIVEEMAGEMEGHMAKEEEQVFPYLTAVEKAGGKKEGIPNPFQGGPMDNHPLKVLMWEHGMTGEEFLELHRLTQDFTVPEDACPSYRSLYWGLIELEEDLHRHVHLENNVLFRRAVEQGILD